MSTRLDPGPWVLRGEVVLSGAAITVGPTATPEEVYGAGKGGLPIVTLLEAGTTEVDAAGGPVVAHGELLAHHNPQAGLASESVTCLMVYSAGVPPTRFRDLRFRLILPPKFMLSHEPISDLGGTP